jgi:hypothetical protein
MRKQVIDGIRVMLSEWDDKPRLESGFLECLSLQRWVETKPESFLVENWEGEVRWRYSDPTPPIGWKKVDETIFSGVNWIGDVEHSCSEEMSACHSSVYFTYKEKKIKSNSLV